MWSSPGPDGGRTAEHSLAVALPGVTTSPEAEAWGCRPALELAVRLPLDAGPVAIAGDNLGVV
eukprot:1864108-Alexandrium_andersonii.AAC.1